MRKLMALAGCAMLAATPIAQALDCPVEQAVWEMKPQAGQVFRIRMVGTGRPVTVVSDLYLQLTTPQRDYWFQFDASTGYPTVTLSPVSAPAKGARSTLDAWRSRNPDASPAAAIDAMLLFYAFDAAFEPVEGAAASGMPAPAFLMLPELGRGLWYHAAAFTSDPDASQDPMPRGIFRLSGCTR